MASTANAGAGSGRPSGCANTTTRRLLQITPLEDIRLEQPPVELVQMLADLVAVGLVADDQDVPLDRRGELEQLVSHRPRCAPPQPRAPLRDHLRPVPAVRGPLAPHDIRALASRAEMDDRPAVRAVESGQRERTRLARRRDAGAHRREEVARSLHPLSELVRTRARELLELSSSVTTRIDTPRAPGIGARPRRARFGRPPPPPASASMPPLWPAPRRGSGASATSVSAVANAAAASSADGHALMLSIAPADSRRRSDRSRAKRSSSGRRAVDVVEPDDEPVLAVPDHLVVAGEGRHDARHADVAGLDERQRQSLHPRELEQDVMPRVLLAHLVRPEPADHLEPVLRRSVRADRARRASPCAARAYGRRHRARRRPP